MQISWHLPYSRGKPQKTSARRPSDEGAVRPVIASNGSPFLQMRSVGSHSTSRREKEGIKERTGSINDAPYGDYKYKIIFRYIFYIGLLISVLNSISSLVGIHMFPCSE